ncbi:MAG: TrmJ/YjtD family RNA methyltransferase [Desulfurococcaceae archaeon]
MKIRVVLVGIEGSANLGMIARTCVNFNIKELYLVNPLANIEEAIKYSAKGKELLLNCKIVTSIEEAVKDVELSVATSSIGFREGDVLRQAISIEDFVNKITPRTEKIAIIFGRESSGLTRDEIEKADILVTIPANPEYPVLNIAQSVAIFLWEMWKRINIQPANIPTRAGKEELEKITKIIENISRTVLSTDDKIRKILILWKRILARSTLSQYEARLLEYWLRKIERRLFIKNK